MTKQSKADLRKYFKSKSSSSRADEIEQTMHTEFHILKEQLRFLYLRIAALEKALIVKIPEITPEVLSDAIADMEDEINKRVRVGEVQKGDLVRAEITTQVKDEQDVWGDPHKVLIPNVGSGDTIGQEIEDEILGMRENEIKTSTIAKIKIDRISRARE